MYSQEVFFMQTQYLIPPEVPQVPPYEVTVRKAVKLG